MSREACVSWSINLHLDCHRLASFSGLPFAGLVQKEVSARPDRSVLEAGVSYLMWILGLINIYPVLIERLGGAFVATVSIGECSKT